MTTKTETTEAWRRYSAAMEALTGIKQSLGDQMAVYNFRIWQMGYLAGITDSYKLPMSWKQNSALPETSGTTDCHNESLHPKNNLPRNRHR